MKTSNKIAIITTLFSVGLLYASVHALIGDVKPEEVAPVAIIGGVKPEEVAPVAIEGAFKHIKIVGGQNFSTEDGSHATIHNTAEISLADAPNNKVLLGRAAGSLEQKTIVNDTLFLAFRQGHKLGGLPGWESGTYTLKEDIVISCKDLVSITLVDSYLAYNQQTVKKLSVYAQGRSSFNFWQGQRLEALKLSFKDDATFVGYTLNNREGFKDVAVDSLKLIGQDNASFNVSGLQVNVLDSDLEENVSVTARQAFLKLPAKK